MKSLLKIVSFIGLFALQVIAVDFAVQFVFHRDPDLLLHHGIGQFVFYALFVFNVVIFQIWVNRQSFLSLGLKPYPHWLSTFLKGWAAGVAAFVIFTLLQKAFGIIEFRDRWGFERILTAFLVSFSAFGIATTEEILFRGFFFQTLLKGMSKWPAIVITGILFVLFHDLAHIYNFWTVPKHMMLAGGLFCLNILICFAYLKTRALYLPIAIHSGLVFGKIFFRKMKLIEVLDPNSYAWGIDGDARRGFMSWLLFLGGIFILKYLITKNNQPSKT